MSKWYEVEVTAVTVFAVEVTDDEGEEEALEYATNEVSGGDVSAEATLITGESLIESTKRHADEVLRVPEE